MDVPLPIINLDTFLADPTSPQSQAEADQVSPLALVPPDASPLPEAIT